MSRHWRLSIAAVGGMAAVLLQLAGAVAPIQGALTQVQDRLIQRSASGHVVVVELDARSMQFVDQWPWPRELHGRLVDRLVGLGAARVAFDVDFAAASTPRSDRLFAEAIARSDGRVVLPALTQSAGSGSTDVADFLPLPLLRSGAMLAAVNVLPRDDGRVLEMPTAMMVAGVPRPSLPALLAGRSASAGEQFPIDFSIAADSVPRLSAVDVLNGRVAPSAVAGRQLIVGATDIRLGDRYPAPGLGMTPGVVLQALATETLLSDRPRVRVNGWLMLFLTLAALWIVFGARRGRHPAAALVLAGSLLAIAFAARLAGQIMIDVVPAIAACLAAATLAAVANGLRRRRAERLTDPASGRPNRAALVAAAPDDAHWIVAARVLNLVAITDAVGELAALRLLGQVMDRMEIGALGSRCYRLGGDRLAARAVEEDAEALTLALERLSHLMRTPVVVDGRALDVQVAFGFAPLAGDTAAALAAAEVALANAERRRLSVAAAADRAEDDWSLSLLGELDHAIAAGQIWVAFQPKLDVASGRIRGSEALVRWLHPERGPVRPDEFIPMAEAHGRLDELTATVLEQAIAGTQSLRRAGHDLGVAVNISTDLLRVGTLAKQIDALLVRHAFPAAKLTLEVTESQPIDAVAEVRGCLAEIKALGVRVSIDDYGTGQSTLSYLKTLRADELKIDQSFVRAIGDSAADATLVRSTIDLAHELGLAVVAEGVEDAATLAQLVEWGCDTIQGYHVARPMPLDELRASLATERRAA